MPAKPPKNQTTSRLDDRLQSDERESDGRERAERKNDFRDKPRTFAFEQAERTERDPRHPDPDRNLGGR